MRDDGCAWEFRNDFVLTLLSLRDIMGEGFFLPGVPCLLVLVLLELLKRYLSGERWKTVAGSLMASKKSGF